MSMNAFADAATPQTRAIATKSSFYLAMRILEPPRRDAMFAIYAFCRAVDDIADDEGDRAIRRAALDQWRSDLDELYAGRIRPRCGFLAEPVRRFRLDRADFEAVIDGMAMDVDEDIRAPEWEKLELYCDRVASAVGRLSVRAFGLADEVEGAECELPTGPKLARLSSRPRAAAHQYSARSRRGRRARAALSAARGARGGRRHEPCAARRARASRRSTTLARRSLESRARTLRSGGTGHGRPAEARGEGALSDGRRLSLDPRPSRGPRLHAAARACARVAARGSSALFSDTPSRERNDSYHRRGSRRALLRRASRRRGTARRAL